MKDIFFLDLKKANLTDFLRMLRSPQQLHYTKEGEVSYLQHKTLRAMITETYGAYKCLGCGTSPQLNSGRLEGHHINEHRMYICHYRHCSGPIKRQEALNRLKHELLQSVVPLCKACHELAHHQPDM
jgi:uncharacterized protein YyaL (SSP411 family)